jgi:hypothetical protein
MRTRTLLLAPAVAMLAAAVPALASDPSSGTVSKAAPKFEWKGTSNAYGVYPLHGTAGPEFGSDQPCEAPACDAFALEVADQDLLTLTADNVAAEGPGGDFIEMDVVQPDGEVIYSKSAEDAPVIVKIKNAPKGAYEVRVYVNQPAHTDGSFNASALLGTATKPAPAPAAPAPGQPAPAPAPAAPAAEPAATLSLKTKSASAKKVKKSLKLSLGSSKPVTNVQASIKKGTKVLGTAKLASMGTSGKVALKLKKALKKGSYTIAITANDGGRTVGLSAKLAVKK